MILNIMLETSFYETKAPILTLTPEALEISGLRGRPVDDTLHSAQVRILIFLILFGEHFYYLIINKEVFFLQASTTSLDTFDSILVHFTNQTRRIGLKPSQSWQ